LRKKFKPGLLSQLHTTIAASLRLDADEVQWRTVRSLVEVNEYLVHKHYFIHHSQNPFGQNGTD